MTRTVFVGRRWAMKVPTLRYRRNMLRGWLANRSEWRQRKRRDVARPVATLFHLVLVMPSAYCTGDQLQGKLEGPWFDRAGDEAKPCSWGWFRDRGWRLVDYDAAWEPGDRGLVGGVYYWIQERRARRWMRLPSA